MPVTHDTIEGAIKWLWDLDRLAGVSKTACVEAVLRACEDKQVSFTFICYLVVVGSQHSAPDHFDYHQYGYWSK